MAKYATKAKENIFTQARYNAAKFNDRLNSREGASEELGIDRSRLARIELGSKNPFPDEVLMMSDIYNGYGGMESLRHDEWYRRYHEPGSSQRRRSRNHIRYCY